MKFNEYNFRNIACVLFSIVLVISLIQMFFMKSNGNVLKSLLNKISSMERFSNSESTPALVMFHADWCGHCKKAKPDFMKLAKKFKNNPDVNVLMLNAEDPENKELVKKHDVKGYPTIKLCKNGLNDVASSEVYEGPRGYDNLVKYLQVNLPENFANPIGDGLQNIGRFFNEAGEDIGGIVNGTARGVGSLYQGGYNAVGSVGDNLLQAGGQLINAPFQGAGSLVNGSGFDESMQQFAHGLGGSVQTAGQAVYSGVNNVGSGLISGWNEFEDGFAFLNKNN